MPRRPFLTRSVLLHYVAPVLVLAACVGGFFALGAQKVPPRRMPVESAPMLVRTAPLQSYDGPVVIATSGLVVPFREIEVAAEVRGNVLRKNAVFEVGRYVAEGTELVAIDPTEYELAVSRLTTQLEQADAELAEIDAQIDGGRRLAELVRREVSFAEKNVQRISRLRQANATSEADFENVQREQLAAEQKVAQLENQLTLLQAQRKRLEAARKTGELQLAQARLDLRRTVVVAPLSGFVVSERVQRGGHLQPGDPIAVIEDATAAEVQCQLRMDELRWVAQVGQASSLSMKGERQAGSLSHEVRDYELPPVPATVHFRLGTSAIEWQGVLSGFDQLGLNEKTRTVPCRVLVSQPRSGRSIGIENTSPEIESPAADNRLFLDRDPSHGIRSLVRGMFVEVRLHCETSQPLLRIPEVALLPGDRAWVVTDGRLRQVRLDVVGVQDGTVIIARSPSALGHDQRVVVSPVAHAVDGMKVREEKAFAQQSDSKPSIASLENAARSERSVP